MSGRKYRICFSPFHFCFLFVFVLQRGYTLLHGAAEKARLVEILTLLVAKLDIPVDISDFCGRTALHVAAISGNWKHVKELLNLGANALEVDVVSTVLI